MSYTVILKLNIDEGADHGLFIYNLYFIPLDHDRSSTAILHKVKKTVLLIWIRREVKACVVSSVPTATNMDTSRATARNGRLKLAQNENKWTNQNPKQNQKRKERKERERERERERKKQIQIDRNVRSLHSCCSPSKLAWQ